MYTPPSLRLLDGQERVGTTPRRIEVVELCEGGRRDGVGLRGRRGQVGHPTTGRAPVLVGPVRAGGGLGVFVSYGGHLAQTAVVDCRRGCFGFEWSERRRIHEMLEGGPSEARGAVVGRRGVHAR